jgi:hypothetical protein
MPIHEFVCEACAHQFELLVLKSTVQPRGRSRRAPRPRDSKQGAERMAAQRAYEQSHND